ncbi:MAG: HNH endonuclease [Nitrososphaeria archaeon]|jgi:endogenous inhibitor of DNA gyrase (YacG/DUF329 family)
MILDTYKNKQSNVYLLFYNELFDLYITQRKNTRDVAKIFKVSQPTIRKILKEYEIPIRSISENKGSGLTSFTDEHKTKIANALKNNTNFINIETGKHFNDQRVEINCYQCGKLFLIGQYNISTYNFCSRKCDNEYKKTLCGANNKQYSQVEVECAWCGTKIFRQKGLVAKRSIFFCCQKHNGLWKALNLKGENSQNYKGGYENHYGENWLIQRRSALTRDDYTCQICFKHKKDTGRNPDVHHKIPFRVFSINNYIEANNLDNLVSLCSSCHSKQTYI